MQTKPSVEVVNTPSVMVKCIYRTIGVSDLASMSPVVTDVSFVKCYSKEWMEIGKRLATSPQLKILSAEHCDSEDSLCVGICGSKSLVSLRMGKLLVTQRTAASLTKEFNNCAKSSNWWNCVSAAPRKRPIVISTLSLLTGLKQCSKHSPLCRSWISWACNCRMWRSSKLI
jgi:hypothetical protein